MLVRCLGRSEVPVCWFLRHLSTKKQHFLSPSFVVAFLVPDTFYLLVICLKFYLKYFLFFFFLICVQEVEQNKQTNKTVFQHLVIFLSYLSKRQVTQPAVYRETRAAGIFHLLFLKLLGLCLWVHMCWALPRLLTASGVCAHSKGAHPHLHLAELQKPRTQASM